jgi:hypothetical protein
MMFVLRLLEPAGAPFGTLLTFADELVETGNVISDPALIDNLSQQQGVLPAPIGANR